MAEDTEDYARPARRARVAERLVAILEKDKKRVTDEQTEARFQKSLHHDSALLHLLWRKKKRCVRSSRKIPSFSSMCLRLPMAQSVLFALVSKTIQPHFLRSYIFA
jgi:hypothetical protein